MAWLESHQELGKHPKTKKFARTLGISKPAAVGHLMYLWWWALDYAQDGDLSKYDNDDIADAAEWEDDSDDFVNALVKSGFVDDLEGVLAIHDWNDYAGKLMERRQAQKEYNDLKYKEHANKGLKDADRKRDGNICRCCGKEVDFSDRKTENGGTYLIVNPQAEVSMKNLENIVVVCRECNDVGGLRTPIGLDNTALSETSNNNQTISNNNQTISNRNLTISNRNLTEKLDNPTSVKPLFDLTEHNITTHNITTPYPTEQNKTEHNKT
jgi:hypothetical protein